MEYALAAYELLLLCAADANVHEYSKFDALRLRLGISLQQHRQVLALLFPQRSLPENIAHGLPAYRGLLLLHARDLSAREEREARSASGEKLSSTMSVDDVATFIQRQRALFLNSLIGARSTDSTRASATAASTNAAPLLEVWLCSQLSNHFRASISMAQLASDVGINGARDVACCCRAGSKSEGKRCGSANGAGGGCRYSLEECAGRMTILAPRREG